MSPNIKPTLQALLIADRIYTDKDTGKKIVAGIFHQLGFVSQEDMDAETQRTGTTPVFSCGNDAGSPFAYISLTDVRGNQSFALRYVELNSESVMFRCDFDINWDDPLMSVDLAIPLPRLPIGKTGVFALELLWNDEPLGTFRVQVKQIKLPPAKET